MAAHEGQGLCLCVGHVHGALDRPYPACARLEPLCATPEIDDERDGEEYLEQGSAERTEHFAEEAEEDVTGFMNEQIDAVDEVIPIRDREPHDVSPEPRAMAWRTTAAGVHSPDSPSRFGPAPVGSIAACGPAKDEPSVRFRGTSGM